MMFDTHLNSAVQNLINNIPLPRDVRDLQASQISIPRPAGLAGTSGYGPPVPNYQSSAPTMGFTDFSSPLRAPLNGVSGAPFQPLRVDTNAIMAGIRAFYTTHGFPDAGGTASPAPTPVAPPSPYLAATPPVTSTPAPTPAPAPAPTPSSDTTFPTPTPTSTPSPTPSATPPGPATQAANGVVNIAESQKGVPYVWGGGSPQGFDCSGLVQWAYAKVGVSLPHNAQLQYSAPNVTHLTRDQLQPGDLVFFQGTDPSDPTGPIQHVGIYSGNGMMINAPSQGRPVQEMSIDSPYWAQHFAGGGRVH